MNTRPQPNAAELHKLRTFISGTAHLPPVAEQQRALHAYLATFIDDELITSLEAVLSDASCAPGLPPDRVLQYRPTAELLHRLRALQKAALRDATIQVAGIAPH